MGDLEHTISDYTKCITDRAKHSMHDLRPSLDHDPLPRRSMASRSDTYHQRSMSLGRKSTEPADYTYGAAVHKLRDLLDLQDCNPQHPNRTVVDFNCNNNANLGYARRTVSQPHEVHGHVPGPSETAVLLTNQSTIITQNEAQKTYCLEEIELMKSKMASLLEENEMLHCEIQRGIMTGILDNELTTIPGGCTQPANAVGESGNHMTTEVASDDKDKEKDKDNCLGDMNKWRFELSRMSMLHTAKTTRMEVQLQHSQQELKDTVQKLDTVKTQLRTLTSLRNMDTTTHTVIGVNGVKEVPSMICAQCADNEAVIQSRNCEKQIQLDKVTTERDDLMQELTQLRSRHFGLRQIEEASYEQVRKGIEMVEQAQMEQTQALVEKEQLRVQLNNMQSRITEHADTMALKMAEDRRFVRQEMQTEKDELELKLKEMSAALVENEAELQRAFRDKQKAITDLDRIKERNVISDNQHAQDLNHLNMSVTKAHIEKDETAREISKLQIDYDHLSSEYSQEKIRLQTACDNCQRRLSTAEKNLLESREQLISLTNDNRKIEKLLTEAKQAKDHAERVRGEDLKLVTDQYSSRENEMNATIDSIDAKYRSNITELEDLIQNQNQVAYKLQSECKFLNNKLEETTVKFRRDNKHLKAQNDLLRAKLEKQVRIVATLEEKSSRQQQLSQHLRSRVKLLDNRATNSDIHTKGKESSYLQDRRLMQREIDYLRSQFNLDPQGGAGAPGKPLLATPPPADHLAPMYLEPPAPTAAGAGQVWTSGVDGGHFERVGDFELSPSVSTNVIDDAKKKSTQQPQSRMAAVSGIKSDPGFKSQQEENASTLAEDIEDIEDQFEKAASIGITSE